MLMMTLVSFKARAVILSTLASVLFCSIPCSAAKKCNGRGTCPPGQECISRSKCVKPLYSKLDVPNFKYISEIQGTGTVSDIEGQEVTTIGVVTAIDDRSKPWSLWIQDIYEDSDPLSSEALYLFRPVFRSGSSEPAVGDVVSVNGTVLEFVSSRRPKDLPITEISRGTATLEQSGAGIVVGPATFAPPARLSSFGDGTGYEQDAAKPRVDVVVTNYKCSDIRESAMCYYEAHEHMFVRILQPITVTPELRFNEIGVIASSSCKGKCNAVVQPNNFIPRVVTIEDDLVSKGTRNLPPQQRLQHILGVVFYSFTQYKVYNTKPLRPQGNIVIRPAKPCRPSRETKPGLLRIATWNLENRDPKDPDSELSAIARNIARLQRCPDIIGLSEIGDNDGSSRSGVTAANVTLQEIADAVSAKCRRAPYVFSDIAPIDREDGGLPGENIRVAFLFREDKVKLVTGVPKGGPNEAVMFDANSGALTRNPGRISPSSFPDSRKPLAGEFTFVGQQNRQSFIVIVNHWNSKFGDDALFGRIQPPVQASQVERAVQAGAVKSFLDTIPASKPVFVVGDLNDFYFSNPVQSLRLFNLWGSTSRTDRFSFLFQSRLQTLDHILIRRRTTRCRKLCALHSSTLSAFESDSRPTDHDPLVAVCRVARR